MEEKKEKTIKDFKWCPHCESNEGYYETYQVYGTIWDKKTFDGEPENWEMFDHLSTAKPSKYYYCRNCKKRICKI